MSIALLGWRWLLCFS